MKCRGRSREKVMKNVLALSLAQGRASGFIDPEHCYASMCIYLFNASDIIYVRIYG